jgi:hypothetical protein
MEKVLALIARNEKPNPVCFQALSNWNYRGLHECDKPHVSLGSILQYLRLWTLEK